MGQVSAKLRRATNGFTHWCPACEEPHWIPDGWEFDGDFERPTFKPSVRITGKHKIVVDGRWTGDWVRDAAGDAVDHCCHYVLTAGVLAFCGDSTHGLANQSVQLPDLPDHMKDSPP